MLLNSRRERVAACADESTSCCPLCSERLVAKRPQGGLWHWAHYPQKHDHEKCPHSESWWHLRMKLATMLLGPAWHVEVPLEVAGVRYLVDAVETLAGGAMRIVEYVHTLTPYYVEKYKALAAAGHRIEYVFDGEAFVSRRARSLPKVGILQACFAAPGMPSDAEPLRMFLKPKARRMADGLMGCLPLPGTAVTPEYDLRRVQVHVHAQLDTGRTLPLGAAVKLHPDPLSRIWCVTPVSGWLAPVAEHAAGIDLDNHQNNPEPIRDRVRSVEVRKLVAAL